jgi:hypothetical protein
MTELSKEHRNALDRARRRRIAEAEGRECKVGRPALDPDELAERKRETAASMGQDASRESASGSQECEAEGRAAAWSRANPAPRTGCSMMHEAWLHCVDRKSERCIWADGDRL